MAMAPKPTAAPDGYREVVIPHVPSAHPEFEHRDVHGGAARAAVFGVSDGQMTSVADSIAAAVGG